MKYIKIELSLIEGVGVGMLLPVELCKQGRAPSPAPLLDSS